LTRRRRRRHPPPGEEPAQPGLDITIDGLQAQQIDTALAQDAVLERVTFALLLTMVQAPVHFDHAQRLLADLEIDHEVTTGLLCHEFKLARCHGGIAGRRQLLQADLAMEAQAGSACCQQFSQQLRHDLLRPEVRIAAAQAGGQPGQ
jgi:hypothetical protein